LKNAVYEADTLLEAAEKRVDSYKKLQAQIQTLKKAFEGVANLENDFKGKGADNIKSFYKGHEDIANQWLNLIHTQIAFFKTVKTKIAKADLPKGTFVDVSFLTQNLDAGEKQSRSMVDEQKSSLEKILTSIDDIVSLRPFSTKVFEKDMDEAKKERTHTVDDVESLDQELLSDYKMLELLYQAVNAGIQSLMNATERSGEASPMYFNEKTYHSSRAYQVQKETNEFATAYVKEKKLERQAYREQVRAKHQAEVQKANRLHTKKEEKNIFQRSWDGVVSGAGDAIKDTVEGTVSMVKHPIKTAQGIGYAATHLDEVAVATGKQIAKSWDEEMVHGNAQQRSHWIAFMGTEIGVGLLGGKGVDKLSKASKASKLAKGTKEFAQKHAKALNSKTTSLLESYRNMSWFSNDEASQLAFEYGSGGPLHVNEPDVQFFRNHGGSNANAKPERFKNIFEAEEWGIENYKEWENQLTQQEKDGIRDYTGSQYYEDMNNYLRGKDDFVSEDVRIKISAVHNALMRAETPEPLTVYRGTNIDALESMLPANNFNEFDFYELLGQTFKEEGFLSTSAASGSAFEKMVNWTINVPEGANGAYIGHMSRHQMEAEILFDLGHELIIREISDGPDIDGKIYIKADLVKK